MARFRTQLSLLIISLVMSTQSFADIDPEYQAFVGDWELVSYMVFPQAGGERDMNYIGYLSYDPFGNMTGLGMPKDLPQRATGADERITGGFAYWGGVSVDAAGQRVIHHVEGSPMVPQWVGGDNVRYYEFVDDLLKLSLKDDSGRVTATLTWRKLR
ncbi:MAG: lipocalin-like domain-containing protein [Pseudomonadales bacterium]|nr:lipocalin-like domain-containing protein [Pseudomonadales bacterium]